MLEEAVSLVVVSGVCMPITGGPPPSTGPDKFRLLPLITTPAESLLRVYE